MNIDSAEHDWLAQAAAGSSVAFAKLVTHHQQAVRTFLRRLSGSWAEADDLAQEVFIAAWTHMQRFRREQSFRMWLCGIAYRKYLGSKRSAWRRLRRDAEFVTLDATSAMPHSAAALDLRRAMAALPVEQRAVIALCVASDWSHSEAAQALELPLGTVKSHIQRGRAILQQRLAIYALPMHAPAGEGAIDESLQANHHE